MNDFGGYDTKSMYTHRPEMNATRDDRNMVDYLKAFPSNSNLLPSLNNNSTTFIGHESLSKNQFSSLKPTPKHDRKY